MRGSGKHADLLARLFSLACKRLGLANNDWALDTSRFRRPRRGANSWNCFSPVSVAHRRAGLQMRRGRVRVRHAPPQDENASSCWRGFTLRHRVHALDGEARVGVDYINALVIFALEILTSLITSHHYISVLDNLQVLADVIV